VEPGEALLAFGPNFPVARAIRNLTRRAICAKRRQSLFMLRQLDNSGRKTMRHAGPDRGLARRSMTACARRGLRASSGYGMLDRPLCKD